ncbi:protein of unknown function [Bradyrhizobium vignae]|uniref:Uncharacterized protein n=1 Tax=Bradyrhizobium vignae TaxID=1549949 RepID=A0A2U3Q5W4_9BRAD|nr:protein of unknown function [Bradyrhizobium vignae]
MTPNKVTFRLFMWRLPEPVSSVDTLQPAFVCEARRPIITAATQTDLIASEEASYRRGQA